MQIDWATLVVIAVVAAAAALTVVLLVAFALVALSGSPQIDGSDGDGRSGVPTTAGSAVAALCLLAAGLLVCYGLYLIIA